MVFSSGIILDSKEENYLKKGIKSIVINALNDVLEKFLSQSGGLRISNWENLIELDIPLTVQLRRDICYF
ncbi:hypothetical protein [Bacillus cereus]|uniref:hypothetical protein n=1 Tax=Bacillus cereus TaxID=1396 RepID=UPI001595312B|nr:hypothetical protein [Bacillus cereus]